MRARNIIGCTLLMVSSMTVPLVANEQYAASVPNPTLSELAYGDHERQVLDFWKAASLTNRPHWYSSFMAEDGWAAARNG